MERFDKEARHLKAKTELSQQWNLPKEKSVKGKPTAALRGKQPRDYGKIFALQVIIKETR